MYQKKLDKKLNFNFLHHIQRAKFKLCDLEDTITIKILVLLLVLLLSKC